VTIKSRPTLFKAGPVVTMDSTVPNLAMGDVPVDGAEVIAAAKSIVMPGLIDAHRYMWLGVMRRMMTDVDDLFAGRQQGSLRCPT
jgi:5-methylthioadenosine/S-adenosylhomocysteine deaminase